jgi:hypothetical protein
MTLLVDARTITPTTDVLDSDVPTVETPAYTRSAPRWQRCRDVYQGSEAVREAGTLYLPQFAGESDDLYEARKTISALFNGYARTVLASVGLIAQPEPVLGKDMPNPLVDMWENADGEGMHGAVFFRHLVTAAMVDGYSGILTEYPRPDDPTIDRTKASAEATIALATGGKLNAGDQAALNLRPYFILAKVDEVLPIYETVNGQRTLVTLIRREYSTQRKGRFGLQTIVRHHVYELVDGKVMHERWAEPTPGSRPVLDQKPTELKGLTAIPWSPLVAGERLGEHEYKPTLLDLADMNLTHHRIATGMLSIEEQACVPTLVRVGCSPDKDGNYPPILSGPGNTIEVPVTPNVTLPAQPVYYLQVSSDVIEPARKSLENCKAEMGAMGAAFLAPQPVQETAAAKRMDSAAEAASISSVARAAKDCLESAFGFAGQYVNQPGGSVTTNTEFTGEGISPDYLTVCVAAFQQGALTLEELRHVIQTGELPEEFDAGDTKILEELSAQAAARRAQTAIDKALKNQTPGQPGQPNGTAPTSGNITPAMPAGMVAA